jgi:hypothetical protein
MRSSSARSLSVPVVTLNPQARSAPTSGGESGVCVGLDLEQGVLNCPCNQPPGLRAALRRARTTRRGNASSGARDRVRGQCPEGRIEQQEALGRYARARRLTVPVYVYPREDGSRFEIEQRITEDSLLGCPTTGQRVERVLQPFTPRFRGHRVLLDGPPQAIPAGFPDPSPSGWRCRRARRWSAIATAGDSPSACSLAIRTRCCSSTRSRASAPRRLIASV